MNKTIIENAIIVRSKTRLEQLTEKFNTLDQAKFYIKQSQEVYKQKKASKLGKLGFNYSDSPFGDIGLSKTDFSDSKLFYKLLKPVGYEGTFNSEHIKFKTPLSRKIGFGSKKGEEIAEEEQMVTNDFSLYENESEEFYDSFDEIQNQIEEVLKVKVIDQSFLTNYIFTEKDLIIVVGQDGLVANTAKYVNGRPIIAINPDESRYDGILLPFNSYNFMPAVHNVLNDNFTCKSITMAEVKLNDDQRLLAFNDFFIGVSKHSSARYQITYNEQVENHSSSGIIVSTGAGSTGWMSSMFNMANGMIKAFSGSSPISRMNLSQEDEKLLFVVREPFISKTSQAGIVAGVIHKDEYLTIESFMPQDGIIFSDGIQSDYLTFNSGMTAEIGIADEKAVLVI